MSEVVILLFAVAIFWADRMREPAVPVVAHFFLPVLAIYFVFAGTAMARRGASEAW